MFANTIDLTINGSTVTLTRINQDKYTSEYMFRSDAHEIGLRIRNSKYIDKTRGSISVDRHNVEVIETIYPTTDIARTRVRKAYAVFEFDQGDLLSEIVAFTVGALGFLTSANTLKVANWES